MSFDEILQQINNPVFIVIGFIIILLVLRIFNNYRVNAGAKSYIKRANRLRRKKFNGPDLIEFTSQKRRGGSNTYKKLKTNAKGRVEKYFQYKEEELPALVNFVYSKYKKKNKRHLTIFVTNGKRKMIKIKLGKTVKEFIQLANKFDCLDELIRFLHNLPDAILKHQKLEVYIPEHEVSIGYSIK